MVTLDSVLLVTSAISGAAGGTAAVAGLSRWLGDVWLGRLLAREKARYDKELEGLKSSYSQELEAYKDELNRSQSLLKAQIDRSVLVTRAHFETEFEAYKKIFEDLAAVRLVMPSLQAVVKVPLPDETEEDRLKDLNANFAASRGS